MSVKAMGLGSVKGEHYFQFDTTLGRTAQPHRAIEVRSNFLTDRKMWSVSRPMQYRDMYGYESGPRGTPTYCWRSNHHPRSCGRPVLP